MIHPTSEMRILALLILSTAACGAPADPASSGDTPGDDAPGEDAGEGDIAEGEGEAAAGEANEGVAGDEGAADGEGEGETPRPCVVTEETEQTCDGLDNDCDGAIDEATERLGEDCVVGIGACRALGVRFCNSGGDATVCGAEAGPPSREVCDGIDNDCDGSVDEPFTDLGDPCSVGIGACMASGTLLCAEDGQGTACDAVAGDPGEEVCNGVDDDCDGLVDKIGEEGPVGLAEECETGGVGACGEGVEICEEGRVLCVGSAPAEETCNGADDDCDGETDEEASGLAEECETEEQGVCAAGAQRCVEGEARCVRLIEPSDEVCDRLDNDCDGDADEGDPGGGADCETGGRGLCAQGALTCTEGEIRCVQVADAPADESCNGRDDDCDGDVDEEWDDLGDPCAAGVGGCREEGVIGCSDDGESSSCDAVAAEPGFETCNGEDDNCDGNTDEAWPELGDPCEAGLGACRARGRLICDEPGVGVECGAQVGRPTAETCDGFDDDCDGETDEAEEGEPPSLDCEPWEACQEGGCLALCEPDEREPDDQEGRALPIALEQRVRLNFCDDSVDWMTFATVAGQLYDIVTEAEGDSAAPLIDIFDADGAQRGFGAGELMNWRAGETGTHHLRLQNRRAVSGPNTEYSLLIRRACDDDDWEDDDDPDPRTIFHLAAAPQRRTLCEDDDWTTLYVRPDRLYTLKTYDLAGDADTFLRVLKPDGELFLEDDDGGGEPFASEVSFIAERPGYYFVQIGSVGGRYGGDRAYTLGIREDECGPELRCSNAEGADEEPPDEGGDEGAGDFEPGDGVECILGRCVDACEPDENDDDDDDDASRVVLVGEPACRNFCDDDVDYRRVRLLRNKTYDFVTYNVARGLDLQIAFGEQFDDRAPQDGGTDDPRGDLLEDFAVAGFARRDYEFSIETLDEEGGNGRDYCLLVREACDDDEWEHDDRLEAARHIIAGDDLTDHALCDPDWTVFHADRGQWYRVETLNMRGNADTYIEIWAGYGAELIEEAHEGSQERGASRIDFEVETDGDYHVLVRDFEDTFGGAKGYSLYIRPILSSCENDDDCVRTAFCRDGECTLGCDVDAYEENDRPDRAPPLRPGESIEANFCEDTVDWFSFDGVQGETLRFTTESLGDEDPGIRLTVTDESGENALVRELDEVQFTPSRTASFRLRLDWEDDPHEDSSYRLVVSRVEDEDEDEDEE